MNLTRDPNPVLLKELRGRMRGRRAFVVLTGYLVAVGLIVALVYAVALSSSGGGLVVNERQTFGKAIFGIVVWMNLTMISFVAPAVTAGAISSERERQTYDLLRTTLLSARGLVLGKYVSALAFILILLLAALPLQSLAFLFGGVEWPEMIVSTLMLIAAALLFAAGGLLFSSLSARTLVSTVLAFGFTVFSLFGLPALGMVLLTIFGAIVGNSSQQLSATAEAVLIVLAWLGGSTNPIIAGIASEVILLEQGSIWTFSVPLQNGVTLYLLSPWLLFLATAALLTLACLGLSIRRVQRRDTG
jgi:ABC-type transport system involved in multi-copper enzyme maturation permease subunit